MKLFLLILSALCIQGQTLSSSWGWKTNHVVFGDVAFSYPVLDDHRATYLATAAYSHSFNGSNGAMWGIKRSIRWIPRFSLFQQIETGLSHRNGTTHLASQVTVGTGYHLTRSIDWNIGVKACKTIASDPYFTLYMGIAKRL